MNAFRAKLKILQNILGFLRTLDFRTILPFTESFQHKYFFSIKKRVVSKSRSLVLEKAELKIQFMDEFLV